MTMEWIQLIVLHCSVVVIPCLSTLRPGSIPGEVRDLNIFPVTERVLCVLSCIVSSGDPDIRLTTDQGGPHLYTCLVFWSIAFDSPCKYDTREFGL